MTWMETMMEKHNTDEAGVKKIMAERAKQVRDRKGFHTTKKNKLKEISRKAGQISGKVRRERSRSKLDKDTEKYENKIMGEYLE